MRHMQSLKNLNNSLIDYINAAPLRRRVRRRGIMAQHFQQPLDTMIQQPGTKASAVSVAVKFSYTAELSGR
jgi:hypothetical protein